MKFRKLIGLAVAFSLSFPTGSLSEIVRTIDCSIVHYSMKIGREYHEMNITELKKVFSSIPRDCRTTKYEFGNGVIDMVPPSSRCAKLLKEIGGDGILNVSAYPASYSIKDGVLKFKINKTILDPEIGKMKVRGTFELNTKNMIMSGKMTANVKSQGVGMIAINSAQQCQ